LKRKKKNGVLFGLVLLAKPRCWIRATKSRALGKIFATDTAVLMRGFRVVIFDHDHHAVTMHECCPADITWGNLHEFRAAFSTDVVCHVFSSLLG